MSTWVYRPIRRGANRISVISISILEEVERSAPNDGGPGRFGGSLKALVSPFVFMGQQLDELTFARLVDWQIEESTEGLVVTGTTGEAPTLTTTKHQRVLRVAIETTVGRVPVIVGTGTNCTRGSIELARGVKAAGANAALLVTPYYNKPMQEDHPSAWPIQAAEAVRSRPTGHREGAVSPSPPNAPNRKPSFVPGGGVARR